MKRIIMLGVLILLAVALTSCSKDEIPNCYTITAIEEEVISLGSGRFRTVTVVRAVRNGNKLTVGIDPTTVRVGDEICN